METTRTNIEHAVVRPEYLYNDTTSSAAAKACRASSFYGRRKRHAIMFYCVHMPVVFSKGAKPSGMDWRLLASAPEGSGSVRCTMGRRPDLGEHYMT